jgi:hypothetical protein
VVKGVDCISQLLLEHCFLSSWVLPSSHYCHRELTHFTKMSLFSAPSHIPVVCLLLSALGFSDDTVWGTHGIPLVPPTYITGSTKQLIPAEVVGTLDQ